MTLPLEDIRILDLSRLLPGPYCSMLLADLGAEVIKFEQPGKGDYVRDMIPEIFMSVNRNKKSVTLSLKSDRGKEVFYRMVEKSDVVLEGFSPGVTKRLGVDYEKVSSINPMIVYCSISGFGQDGPYRDIPGHDINYLGVGGVLSIPGQVGRPPAKPGIPVGDLSSSMFAALSILAALRVREKIGSGQYIDVSMTDGIVSWMSVRAGGYLTTGDVPEVTEMGHLAPTNDIFETKDKKKVTLGALEEHFWEGMCRVLGLEELLDDPRYDTHRKRVKNGEEISEKLKAVFLTKTRTEWIEEMNKARIPCGPVFTMEEVFSDPHIIHRGLLKEIDDPKLGRIKQVPFPVKFSKTPAQIKSPPPEMGQHTEEVFLSFGYSKEEIEQMRKEKVI
jgi:crotonobetainyl-CoA:carnitine CoA-transferase CaiB-like acyl-CoA transferase